MKVAIVTGGSSGIGLCTAKRLKDAGCKVYEFSRRDMNTDGINHIACNVTDEVLVASSVKQVTDTEGHIDILVCCAGFGISGAVEFTKAKDAKRQIDVNFFGTVNTVKACLPVMRQQHSGRIICVSSVAGAIAIPFQTFYSVSKAAINSYCRALRNEVKPFGIEVAAVMPGDICTGFTDARDKNLEGDDIYGGRIARSVAGMEKDERNGMPADTAGRFISRLALKRNIKPVYAIGAQYSIFAVLSRILPERLVCFIVGKMYAM
jgi:NAD(P)-dependent dehydrogenase (short-subunit alcohol dehydrogenase family)